ncbi:MAG: peptidylprolyl isomerase [Clostridia bacterium]|nr:peptidylprolyl isomerase [Clostridia bacterium]
MQKKILYSAISLILSLSLLLSLASCGKKDESRDPAALTLGGAVIGERAYHYKLCTYKGELLASYEGATDTDAFWDRVISGERAEDVFFDMILGFIKSDLVSSYLFDLYGLSITEDDEATARELLSDLECELSGGEREAFDRDLSEYGVDADLLLEIMIDDLKPTYVYNHAFESGILTVGTEEKQSYLEENYARVRQIYINNKDDPEKSYYDGGSFVAVPLGDEAKAAADAKIAACAGELAAGVDFDAVREKYSEDESYPNGYYISSSTKGVPEEFIETALSTPVGEYAECESEYGAHFIKRIMMDHGAWAAEENEDFFAGFTDAVYNDVFVKFIGSYYDKIEVDQSVIDKYKVRAVPPNYNYRS